MQLAADELRQRAMTRLPELLDVTMGNPLFAREVLRELAEAGDQVTIAEVAPGGVRSIVARRLVRLTPEAGGLLAAARHTGKSVSGSPLRWSLEGGLVVVLLVFVVNAPGLLKSLGKFRLAARPEKSPRLAATIWYERMTKRVARRGWRKSPTQTPDEFVSGIDDAGVRERVAEFTRHYESARFDDSVEDVRRLPELYEEISRVGR